MTELDIFNNAIHNLEKDIPITWDWKVIAPKGYGYRWRIGYNPK